MLPKVGTVAIGAAVMPMEKPRRRSGSSEDGSNHPCSVRAGVVLNALTILVHLDTDFTPPMCHLLGDLWRLRCDSGRGG